jgi:hypothetical protein
MNDNVLWDDRYVEARWGKKPGFMSDLRSRGQGPAHLRLSARVVRYRPADVLAYEEQQRFQNAAEGQASSFAAPMSSVENHIGRLSRPKRSAKRKDWDEEDEASAAGS